MMVLKTSWIVMRPQAYVFRVLECIGQETIVSD